MTNHPEKPRLSKTALETYARCPRLYKYQYVDNKTTKFPNDILTFGTEFHNGLEHFWSGRKLYGVHEDLFEDPDQAILCQELLRAYTNNYSLDEVQVLCLEEKFEIPTAISTRVAIFDAIVKYRGRTLLVESKTTRSYIDSNSWYWNKLDLDVQIGYYVWFAKEKGYEIDGVLYDVSRVPKMKKGKIGRRKYPEETTAEFRDRVREELTDLPQDYFVRKLINPDVDEVMHQVNQWERMMSASHDLDIFPKNHNSCGMYGKTCEFKPVCVGRTDVNDTKLYTIRKAKVETT